MNILKFVLAFFLACVKIVPILQRIVMLKKQ